MKNIILSILLIISILVVSSCKSDKTVSSIIATTSSENTSSFQSAGNSKVISMISSNPSETSNIVKKNSTSQTTSTNKPSSVQYTSSENIIPITSLKFEMSTYYAVEGLNYDMPNILIEPSNATNKSLDIVSSDINIVSFSNPKLYALKPGTVILRAISNNNIEAQCNVVVSPKIENIPVSQIVLTSPDNLLVMLKVGQRHTLTAIAYPDNATNKYLTWSTSNSNVADIIDSNTSCIVYGKNKGSAVITITASNGVLNVYYVTVY